MAIINGTAQDDVLLGFITNDTLFGLAGNDSLSGGDGDDFLDGGDGNDTLRGGNGNDQLFGGNGNDDLDGGSGIDVLRGDAGDDIYRIDSSSEINQTLVDTGIDTVISTVTYSLGANQENLTLGGSAALQGTGNAGANILIGNGGANILTGGDGNDVLNGGDGNDQLLGGSGNDDLDGGSGVDVLRGDAGNDTYRIDDVTEIDKTLADDGTDTVISTLTYSLGANQENLTLGGSAAIQGTGNAGANILIGNGASNTLTGGDGNDILDGGFGVDLLSGGNGDDIYVIDGAAEINKATVDAGIDTVQSGVSYDLGANQENLTLTGIQNLSGSGNSLANLIIGNSGNNILNGGDGVDELRGGDGADTLDGGVGVDLLAGGNGNDTYLIDGALEIDKLALDAGVDLVMSTASYALGDNQEHLTLTGNLAVDGTGNGGANLLTGNNAGNILSGGGGDDTLFGGGGVDTLLGGDGNDQLDGGEGVDQLGGGVGDDTYIVDDAAEIDRALADSGVDLVISKVSYTLGEQQENLTLTGTGLAIDGTGNSGANIITGNDASNTLNGGGGNDELYGATGVDVLLGGDGNDFLDGGGDSDHLSGGAGDDTYLLGDETEIDTALNDSGVDLVLAAFSYALGDQQENLTLTGSGAIDGFGNSSANLITGNDANNVLRGGEGNDLVIGGNGDDILLGDGGTDVLRGDAGNDIYVVDQAGEVDAQSSDSGTDVVAASVDYTLGNEQENLVLIGAGAINGTGNGNANALIGNDASNVLHGGNGDDILRGGLGLDHLFGDDGNDFYLIDNTLEIDKNALDNGIDWVATEVSYTLGAQQENLVLLGSAALNGAGNTGANTLIGNDAANILDGGDGNDILFGGLGNDILRGGNGDDIYLVDANAEIDTQSTDAGIDIVVSSVGFTLGAQQENLILTGTLALAASGNASANLLLGNDGNNLLHGNGGDDTLAGGNGADSLFGDDGNDRLDGGAGHDSYSGGAGDDFIVLDIEDSGSQTDGGSGTDTLLVSTAGQQFDAVSLAATIGIEVLDLRGLGTNHAQLDAALVAALSDTDIVQVRADAFDTIAVTGAWHADGSRLINGVNFKQYSAAGAVLQIESAGQISTALDHPPLSLTALNVSDGFRLSGSSNVGSGYAATFVGDINGDGFADVVTSGPSANNQTGISYVIFGKANLFAANLDLTNLSAGEGFQVTGVNSGDYTGLAISGAGDVNSDGFDDLLIGAPGADPHGDYSGASYIVFGHAGGFAASLALAGLNGVNGYRLDGDTVNHRTGAAVSAAGDFNADGYDDFLISAPTAGGAADGLSVAFLVYGSGVGQAPSTDLSSLNGSNGVRFDASTANPTGLTSVADAGDINGDGLDDLILGAGYTSFGSSYNGATFVVFGNNTGLPAHFELGSLNGGNGFAINGPNYGSHLGAAVSSAGDFNGDGYADIIIGEPGDAQGQRVGAASYLVFGHAGAFDAALDLNTLNGSNGLRIDGTATAALSSSTSVAAAGDINGDGYDDVVISELGGGVGILDEKTYVLFGHPNDGNPSVNLAVLGGNHGFRIDDLPGDNLAGPEVGRGGDINGDGFDDIVIGAPRAAAYGGASFVIYGRDFESAIALEGGDANDSLTGSAANEALVGGRGNDVLDGAAGDDALGGGAGDDILVYDAQDHRIDGGSGTDTLRVNGHDQTLDLTAIPPARLLGLDVIDMTGIGNNTLRLNLSDVLAISDHAALRVDGNAGDTLTMLTSGWSHGANQVINAQTYASYTLGGAKLLVDVDITQTVV